MPHFCKLVYSRHLLWNCLPRHGFCDNLLAHITCSWTVHLHDVSFRFTFAFLLPCMTIQFVEYIIFTLPRFHTESTGTRTEFTNSITFNMENLVARLVVEIAEPVVHQISTFRASMRNGGTFIPAAVSVLNTLWCHVFELRYRESTFITGFTTIACHLVFVIPPCAHLEFVEILAHLVSPLVFTFIHFLRRAAKTTCAWTSM